MNRFKKTKGAVSIFLVIILVPMMTVSALFVDASKVSLAKSVSESAGDLTLNTALTDYDTKLKDMYGLLRLHRIQTNCMQVWRIIIAPALLLRVSATKMPILMWIKLWLSLVWLVTVVMCLMYSIWSL